MTVSSKTPLLDQIKTPEDLRRLQPDKLRQVADELRQETIDAVAVTGGHLGAGLGVVELTVALHYVFDTPTDRLVWDVGHLPQLGRFEVPQILWGLDLVEQWGL